MGAPLRPGGCNSYQARDLETGREVVVKLLAAMPFEVDLAQVEAAVAPLRAMEAVFVPRIYGLVQTRILERHAVFLVQERLAGVSLASLVAEEGPLSEERARQVARHLLEVLRFTGQQEPPLVHGDMEPHNVLVREEPGGIALVDWAGPKAAARDGASQEFGPNGWSQATSREFAAPEVPMGSPNPRSDLYGVGACVAFALTAKAPDALRALDLRRLLIAALAKSGVSEGLAGILARLMDVTSEKRLASAQEALEALRDTAALGRDRPAARGHTAAADWHLAPEPLAGRRWAALGVGVATLPVLPMLGAAAAALVPIWFGMGGWVVLARLEASLILGELSLLTLRAGLRAVAGLGHRRPGVRGRSGPPGDRTLPVPVAAAAVGGGVLRGGGCRGEVSPCFCDRAQG